MSLRNPLPSVTEALQGCSERYFITLTTPKSLSGIDMSRAFAEVLHRVNRALFGTAYHRHGRTRLIVLAVQEHSYSQELHTHAIIGVPNGALADKAFRYTKGIPQLIIETWCRLDCGGLPQAQDAKPVFDLPGVTAYITKKIKNLASLDGLDINNCTSH